MQGEPIEPVLALQKEFKLVPLSAYGNKAPSAPSNKTLPPLPAIKDGGLAFLEYLSFALKSNPIKAADEALFAQFSRIGLTTALGRYAAGPIPPTGCEAGRDCEMGRLPYLPSQVLHAAQSQWEKTSKWCKS
jgi:hypothetical protein